MIIAQIDTPQSCDLISYREIDELVNRVVQETPATPPSSARGELDYLRTKMAESFDALTYDVDVLPLRFTFTEHPIVRIVTPEAEADTWIGFVESVFPESRNMSASEHARFEAIVFSHGTKTGRRRLRRI